MDPSFLRLYNEELQFIREKGAEFATEYPKIAGRLGLEGFECADPYVERLLEGFAFLTARVRLKLDAEFPRFTQHLLEMVYPHSLVPIPSMTVVQFHPDLTEGSLAQGYVLPRDTSLRGTMGRDDQTACEYRTAHATTLWPLEIVEAQYFNREVTSVPLPDKLRATRAGVRIRLRCTAGLKFSNLNLDELSLYVRGGPLRTYPLYEQILSGTQAVVLQSPSGSLRPEVLEGSAIRPEGFADHQALLPATLRSFQGYRLLQEYFAFPQRFLFFQISGMRSAIKKCHESVLDIILTFDRSQRSLENVIDAGNFAMFCTPAINLFPQRADRIQLNHRTVEHHVVPDRVRPQDLEVFQVARVAGHLADSGGKGLEFRPFYAVSNPHSDAAQPEARYFTVRREQRVLSQKQRRVGPRASYIGSEVFLSIVDAQQAPYQQDLEQLEVETLCTNRDLPLVMPVGKGTTDFNLQVGAPVQSVRCIAGPTEPRPPLSLGPGENAWRLINHLSLNYLSLVDNDAQQGAAGLRALLALYADPLSPELRKQVDGIRSVQSRPVVRRLPKSGPLSFGRGVEITLTYEETAFEGYGSFLMSAVLAQFFARYVSINSFTETVLRTTDRGEVHRWPAMIGQRQII